MRCHFPPPLDEDEISAILDGEASPETLARLQQCQDCICRDRVEAARRFEDSLKRELRSCPTPQQLMNYNLHLLPEAESDRIAEQLDRCDDCYCKQELNQLRAFLSEDDMLPDLHEELPFFPPERPLPRILPAQPLPHVENTRVRGKAESRRGLVVRAEDTTIFIEAEPEDTGLVTITGQLLTDEINEQNHWEHALVELRQAGQLQATATVDHMGEFRMGGFSAAGLEQGLALRINGEDGQVIALEELVFSGPEEDG